MLFHKDKQGQTDSCLIYRNIIVMSFSNTIQIQNMKLDNGFVSRISNIQILIENDGVEELKYAFASQNMGMFLRFKVNRNLVFHFSLKYELKCQKRYIPLSCS